MRNHLEHGWRNEQSRTARRARPGSRSSKRHPGLRRHGAFDDFAVDVAVWFAGLLFFEELFVGAQASSGQLFRYMSYFNKTRGKTGAGGFVLGPGAVRVLHADEVFEPRTREGRWGSPKVQSP